MEPVDLLAEMKNMKASMEELRTERLGEAKIMPVPIPNSILPVQESSIHFLACFSLEKESSRATSRVGYHLQFCNAFMMFPFSSMICCIFSLFGTNQQ